jgi:hypothetical protein
MLGALGSRPKRQHGEPCSRRLGVAIADRGSDGAQPAVSFALPAAANARGEISSPLMTGGAELAVRRPAPERLSEAQRPAEVRAEAA